VARIEAALAEVRRRGRAGDDAAGASSGDRPAEGPPSGA
jgi:hypothetical protein